MNLLINIVITLITLNNYILLGNTQCTTTQNSDDTDDYFIYVTVEGDDDCGVTFDEAVQMCVDTYQTTLATILDSDENERAFNARDDSGLTHYRAWIGLTDQNEEGTFLWTEGIAYEGYNNWADGEPNDWATGQDCATMIEYTDNNEWDDLACDVKLNAFVCNSPARKVTCTVEEYTGVYFPGGSFTWSEAEAYCQSEYDTSLASITSSDDNDDVADARQCTPGVTDSDRWCWIGLEYDDNNDEYSWSDGTTYSYDNIVSNPFLSGNCGVIYPASTWDRIDCDLTQFNCFICAAGENQITSSPTMRPTTTQPTKNPTSEPTPRPTARPTNVPADTPSPVSQPADTPSPSVSGIWWSAWWDTQSPTSPTSPTAPTDSNAGSPSTPTNNLTPSPTSRPTNNPTNKPTDAPNSVWWSNLWWGSNN